MEFTRNEAYAATSSTIPVEPNACYATNLIKQGQGTIMQDTTDYVYDYVY